MMPGRKRRKARVHFALGSSQIGAGGCEIFTIAR